MRLHEFSLPLTPPLSTAAGEIRERTGIAVRVDNGVGEATPLPGWTESFEECQSALESIDRSADAASVANGVDHGQFDGTPAARHGLSLAVADRAARGMDRPLYRVLGSEQVVERLPVNSTVGGGDPEETADAAATVVENGFETIKCKVGARPVDGDVARVRAIREAVGSNIELRLDANGAWTREQAGRALDALAEFDIEYVEQPLAPDDIAGHRKLADEPIDIALDESLAGRTPKEIAAIADAAAVFVLKPMALGGVDRLIEIGQQLDDVVVTTTIDAAIARAGAVHAAAALGVERACGLATADLLAEDLAPDPAPVSDGAIAVPQEPGLGTDGPWNGGERDA